MWQRCLWLMAILVWGHIALGQTVFRQAFGDSLCYDEGYSIIPYGNSYLVSTASQCGSGWQSRLLLLDGQGDSLDAFDSIPYNGYVRKASNGNYLFLGGNRAGLAYDTILIAEVTSQLDTVWTRSLFFPECNNQVYDLIEVADGYVITGIYSEILCSGGGASYQSFATKLDFNGDILWQNTYGNVGDDELFVVREKPNGQLWYYGWQRDGGNAEPWLLITDGEGDSITSYGSMLGIGFSYGFDLTADGGFITIGYDDSIYARKFDASLNLQWQLSLGIQSGGLYFRAFEMQDLNYGFLACLDGPNGCNSHLFKLNQQGDVVWMKNWDGLLREVCEPEPGQFLLTGYTNNFPLLPQVLAIRFDTIFDSIPNAIREVGLDNEFTIYPNPAQGEVSIASSAFINEITILSTDGRTVLNKVVGSSNQVSIDLPMLPQGLYIIKIETTTGDMVFSKLQLVR